MRLLLLSFLCSLSTGAGAWTVTERAPLSAPAGTSFERLKLQQDGRSAELHVFSFPTKTHTLAVADNVDGSATLESAARAAGAVAGVNGGYFHPDHTPLGLVVSGGATLHKMERARLLSGLVVAARSGLLLPRASEYKAGANTLHALQAGPFLVDAAKPVAGLNATRPAARTAVAAAGGRWALVTSSWVTLADMGNLLAAPEIVPGGRIARALNLDGGSSTGMWVGSADPYYRREAREVRNYLLVVPRK